MPIFNQPLAIIFKEDKLEYYQALEASRIEDEENLNLQPIRNFMFAQQTKHLSLEIEKFEAAERQQQGRMTFLF